MTPMTQRRIVLLLVALLAVGNVVNALNKGGDFDVFLEAGRRVVVAAPMYAGSGAGSGVIGPPFQGVFFAPFALLAEIEPKAAKLAWHIVNCLALLFALLWWSVALGCQRPEGAASGRGSALALTLVPLVAILLPLQTNFEHQNLNSVLLALVGAAALWLRRDRQVASGVLVGVATALKAFPGLLILYLLAGRFWRAAAAAVATAAVATASTALFYGTGQSVSLVRTWLAINQQGGWPIRGNNQSLFAMFGRYLGHEGLGASGHLFAASDPLPYWLAAGTSAALLVALLAIVVRARPAAADAPAQMSATLALAVLMSPIAWEHYWVLMFPAFYVLYDRATSRRQRVGFWVCAVLVSGFSRATAGAGGVALARMFSLWTIAGVILFATVLMTCSRSDGVK
jgi:alpha-1,2-mannosyltransferase